MTRTSRPSIAAGLLALAGPVILGGAALAADPNAAVERVTRRVEVHEVVIAPPRLALPCVETFNAVILRCQPRVYLAPPYGVPEAISVKTIVAPPRPPYEDPTGLVRIPGGRY